MPAAKPIPNMTAVRFLEQVARSESTRRAHAVALRRLLDFSGNVALLGATDTLDWGHLYPVSNDEGVYSHHAPLDAWFVERFVAWVHGEGGGTDRTVADALRTVRLFARYLAGEGLHPDPHLLDAVESPHILHTDTRGNYYTPAQALTILQAAGDPQVSRDPLRDFALVLLAFICGPRPGELCTFERSADPGVGIVDGKRGRRPLPLIRCLQEALDLYLKAPERAQWPLKPVFRDDSGAPFTPPRLLTLVRQLAEAAGAPRPTSTYWFRHSAATHLAWAGVPLVAVQQLLGHRDLLTTLVYVGPAMISLPHDPREEILAAAVRAAIRAPTRPAPWAGVLSRGNSGPTTRRAERSR